MASPHRFLQGCTKKKDLASGRQAHSLMMLDDALDSLPLESDSLICLFASYGSLFESSLVFCQVSAPSAHTWHAIIHAYAKHGQMLSVLELYAKVQEAGTRLSHSVFPNIVLACSAVGSIEYGKVVHNDIVRNSVDSDAIIRCTLIDMYARCGNLKEARHLFDSAPKRDAALWGAMIAGYSQHKHCLPALHLLEKMQHDNVKFTNITYLCSLKACSGIGALIEGKIMHDQIIRKQLECDLAIGNALIDMYAKSGSLEAACKVFNELPKPDHVSYGGLITAYVQHGQGFRALELFERVQSQHITPNKVIYICVLKACSIAKDSHQGKVVHKKIVTSGFESDVVLANTLIDMYAKCGLIDESRGVFDLLATRSTISWGAMIAGYVQQGCGHSAIELYEKMQKEHIRADEGTFVSVLKACGISKDIEKGKSIHEQVIKDGIMLDTLLGSTIIDMYSKFTDMEAAEKVFNVLPHQDVISWSAMITGYVQNDQHRQAFKFFKKMLQDGIKPDRVVFLCILKACSNTGAFNQGKMIHDQIRRFGFDSDVIVCSSLINMYAKCGNIDEARLVFDGMSQQDVVAWGSIIAGYAHNGKYKEAKDCIDAMERKGFTPKSVLGILSACSLGGHMDKAKNYLIAATDERAAPENLENFNCMIDLLGRSGRLTEAGRMLQSMPIPSDIVGWTALLTSCKLYGNRDLGKECLENITQLDPTVSYGHILMSHIYADTDLSTDFHEIKENKKTYSCIEEAC